MNPHCPSNVHYHGAHRLSDAYQATLGWAVHPNTGICIRFHKENLTWCPDHLSVTLNVTTCYSYILCKYHLKINSEFSRICYVNVISIKNQIRDRSEKITGEAKAFKWGTQISPFIRRGEDTQILAFLPIFGGWRPDSANPLGCPDYAKN